MIRPWPFVGTLIGAVVMFLVLPSIPRSAPMIRAAAAFFYPTAGLLFSLALHTILADDLSPRDSPRAPKGSE